MSGTTDNSKVNYATLREYVHILWSGYCFLFYNAVSLFYFCKRYCALCVCGNLPKKFIHIILEKRKNEYYWSGQKMNSKKGNFLAFFQQDEAS